MRVLSRLVNLARINASIFEKVKLGINIVEFYLMLLLNIDKLPYFADSIVLHTDDAKSIILRGLGSKDNFYTFMELFLDDSYNLRQFPYKEAQVIDIGANIGLFPNAMLYFGITPIQYFGFEPMTPNFLLLKKNTDNLPPKTVFIRKTAIHNSRKKMKFFFDYGSSRSSCLLDNKQKNYSAESVQCITVKDFERMISKTFIKAKYPLIFKLDIEGGEWFIIDDIISSIQKFNAYWFLFESHDAFNKKNSLLVDKVRKRLSQYHARLLESTKTNSTTIFEKKI